MFRLVFSLLVLVFAPQSARSADVIGVSLPLEGRFGPAAGRMKTGALLAAKMLKARSVDIKLKIIKDDCNADTASKTASELIQSKVKIVVGPVCFKYAAALAQALNKNSKNNIPVVTWNTRNPLLKRRREFDHLPLFSLSVAPDAEARAVVEKILPAFVNRPYALLDDGSVYGRSLVDNILLIGEQAGYKPVATSNFRPLQTSQLSVLKRLKRSGVEAVFIAAAPVDVVTIARDMAVLDYDWMIATGEFGMLLPYEAGAEDITPGLLTVQVENTNPADVKSVIKTPEGIEVIAEPSLLAGYSLVEIAAETLSRNKHSLVGEAYNTKLGTVVFDKDGRAAPGKFMLYQWDGNSFKPTDNVTQ